MVSAAITSAVSREWIYLLVTDPLAWPTKAAIVTSVKPRSLAMLAKLWRSTCGVISASGESLTSRFQWFEAGQLTLDLPSPDIPGAHVWRGLAQDQAKQRVTAIEARSKPIAPPRSHAIRRIFVIAIDGASLADPTRLWFDFDYDKPVKKRGRLSGDIIAWSDGCNVTEPFGDGRWMTTQIGCGQETTLPAMRELIGLIVREGVPGFDTLTSGGGPAFGPYSIPDIKTENHRFELREGLR
jgi:hypothetical protein